MTLSWSTKHAAIKMVLGRVRKIWPNVTVNEEMCGFGGLPDEPVIRVRCSSDCINGVWMIEMYPHPHYLDELELADGQAQPVGTIRFDLTQHQYVVHLDDSAVKRLVETWIVLDKTWTCKTLMAAHRQFCFEKLSKPFKRKTTYTGEPDSVQ